MATDSKIAAESRANTGSTASRRLRREGWLPGVVNNDKLECKLIRVNQHDFELMLHAHRSEHLMVDLAIDGGDSKKVLLREVQHDPLSGESLHAEFLEVSLTKKMKVSVQLVLIGEPVGVITEGGRLEHLLRELEVECLPTDLVESIEVDVSGLKIGDVITAGDLTVDSKLTVDTDPGIAVASIAAPTIDEYEPAEGEEGEEGAPIAVDGAEPAASAEPEVIGEKERDEKAKEQEK
jgi:large subunit ribosomal protein L25